MILSQSRTDVFIDTKKMFTWGSPMNLMITFADYFYSKCYCGRSAASADAKGEAMAHTVELNHHHKGPARLCSLDFGEAQQVPQGRRTHRCSVEEHGATDLLMQSRQLLGRDAATEVWPPRLEEISSNFMNWPT